MANERVRVRGLSIYRPIIYGNTATLLTPEERALVDPSHTHRWTVAVRSAASVPDSQSVGGADDLTYFIKRVTFKLHDTYPNPNRTIDKPPFEVTETGWGEFDIQIRIAFIAESGEKPVTTYHHLKLHPWTASVLDPAAQPESKPAEREDQSNPVHAWQYDEIVFNDPFQSFMNILTAHPPTPLPKAKRRPIPFHQADPSTIADTKGGGVPEFSTIMIQTEAERLEAARKLVIAEHDRCRATLIEREKELVRLKRELGE